MNGTSVTKRLGALAGMLSVSAALAAPKVIEGEYLVKLRPEAMRTGLVGSLQRAGFAVARTLTAQNVILVRNTQGVRKIINHAASVNSLAANIASLPGVEYVEPNYVYRTVEMGGMAVVNDPRFAEQWDMKNTGQADVKGQIGVVGADVAAEDAWSITKGSKDIIVGIVDTGINPNHPDLKANLWKRNGKDSEYGFNAMAFWPWDKYKPKDNTSVSHGVHVAGTIGATGDNGVGVAGINSNVTIMAVKSLDDSGGTADDLAEGIDFATNNGARVINASWGGEGKSQTIYDAIARAKAKGVLFVAAAGNGGSDQVGDDIDQAGTYPAAYDLDNIVAVAATDNRDELTAFSNFGKQHVLLGAPGHRILSTLKSNEYAVMSGTSMAAPHVTGAVALLLSKEPNLTYLQVKERLARGVDVVPSLQGKTTSGGRLNLRKLLVP